MAMQGSKPRFVLILLPLLLSLMCQEIVATGRLRNKEGCSSTGIACHAKVNPPQMDQYDEAYVSPPHDDYDYDFYRKHGDIPSPGAGH
ncbi:hypothetical protein PHAVU_009G142300 [Phaseolus vulgaris]|uniref:Uncharacterized protein n=1 Tax=Phaseolus vulgaris TaxID=3885 RepID=V7AYC4_PHAVU|nr:hypothetical protein PHAVU_009G142300g [Phaseolus vulgaris]ESW09618.1 hypothetical protein PHAVU_009G142300g [Phaseolus vulgaris]